MVAEGHSQSTACKFIAHWIVGTRFCQEVFRRNHEGRIIRFLGDSRAFPDTPIANSEGACRNCGQRSSRNQPPRQCPVSAAGRRFRLRGCWLCPDRRERRIHIFDLAASIGDDDAIGGLLHSFKQTGAFNSAPLSTHTPPRLGKTTLSPPASLSRS